MMGPWSDCFAKPGQTSGALPQNRMWALCHGKRLSYRFWLVINRTQEGLP